MGASSSRDCVPDEQMQLEGDPSPSSEKVSDDVGTWDPVIALEKLNHYAEKNPHFTQHAIAWLIVGNVLVFIGLLVLLISEIRMVMTVRSQDTRMQLVEMQYMIPTEKLKQVAEEEKRSVAGRPYLSVCAIVLLCVGFACILLPFCSVLDIIGVHQGAPCALIVLLEGVVLGICLSLFLLALCWSCTRPWAALVLLVISLMGDILCPTGNVLMIGIWAAFAALLFMAYFYWLPSSFIDKDEEVPGWLQSIGPLQISLDIKDWEQVGENITKDANLFLTEAGNNLQTLNPLAPKQRVVGKDGVQPEIGMRVRMTPKYTEKGIGTITEIAPSKKHCTVSWDLGGVESMLYTDGRAEYLVLVEGAESADKSV